MIIVLVFYPVCFQPLKSMINTIQNALDYTQAMQRLLTLIDTDFISNSPEQFAFYQLVTAIENYEQAHIEPIQVLPLDALRFRMEQQGLSPEDLLPVLGSMQRIASILQGKWQLNLSEMKKLNQRFDIPFSPLFTEVTQETK